MNGKTKAFSAVLETYRKARRAYQDVLTEYQDAVRILEDVQKRYQNSIMDVQTTIRNEMQNKAEKFDFGDGFVHTPVHQTIVDIMMLVEKAPDVLTVPGVVTKVDTGVLETLMKMGQLKSKIYDAVVQDAWGTARVSTPKPPTVEE